MRAIRHALRMILGGGVCGCFLGIFAGGLLGSLCELLLRNSTAGLDGALLGFGGGLFGGAAYGLYVSIQKDAGDTPSPLAEFPVDHEQNEGPRRPVVKTRPVLK